MKSVKGTNFLVEADVIMINQDFPVTTEYMTKR